MFLLWFTYGLSSLNNNENIPYPVCMVWNYTCRMGVRNLSNVRDLDRLRFTTPMDNKGKLEKSIENHSGVTTKQIRFKYFIAFTLPLCTTCKLQTLSARVNRPFHIEKCRSYTINSEISRQNICSWFVWNWLGSFQRIWFPDLRYPSFPGSQSFSEKVYTSCTSCDQIRGIVLGKCQSK